MKIRQFLPFLIVLVTFWKCTNIDNKPVTPAASEPKLNILELGLMNQVAGIPAIIDYANHTVTVMVQYNANVAALNVTALKTSPNTTVTYNNNPFIIGGTFNFTNPIVVQVTNQEEGAFQLWTIQAVKFQITASNVPGYKGEVIDPATKTVIVYFDAFQDPKNIAVELGLPYLVNISPASGTPIDATKGAMTYKVSIGEYSENWTVQAIQLITLYDESTPTLGGVQTGWNFEKHIYVNYNTTNREEADLEAYINGDTRASAAYFGGNYVNPTLYVYHGNMAASQTFYNTATLSQVTQFYNAGTPDPELNNAALTANQVFIAKLSNGKFVLIKITGNPVYNGSGANNHFEFQYRMVVE